LVDRGEAIMVMPASFRPSPEVVSRRLGDELVLAHLGTERILVLNCTAARLWELLCAAIGREDLKRTMLDEFEVSETELAAEIETLLESLRREQLIDSDGGS
jgi:hypothetical protein